MAPPTGNRPVVHHHSTLLSHLVPAAPGAPLSTHVHRQSTDNRRTHTETVVVEPPSPVKRARVELNRAHQGVSIRAEAADDSQRYEVECEEDAAAVAKAKARERLTQPADPAMHRWMLNHRDDYLKLLLWRDGRGLYGSTCTCGLEGAIYRCRSCYGGRLLCERCCVESHVTNPLHFIEKWTGTYFQRLSLRDLGLQVQFGHPLGENCTLVRPGREDFVVIADNGIHVVSVADSEPNHVQLLKGGWFPSTTTDPQTCATLECLNKFEYLTLHGKTTPYDFYATLESLTNGTGIKPPDCYAVFLRISRQHAHLLLLKRGGRAYDRYGVLGTGPGELALRCPACPRPGVNLPEGWENTPPEDKCLYVIILAIDACFRLKRRLISNEVRDPGLGTGWAYMVEWEPYREFLLLHKNEKEMNSCSGLRAVDYANTRFSRGYSVTGVGMGICARHEIVLPTSVGDLQAGERFCNMDYIVASFLRHIHELLFKILSYDIACQWTKNLAARVKKLPALVRFQLVSAFFQFAIPKRHIKGARWDKLDNHWSFWNWTKSIKMATLLRRRHDNAIEQFARHKDALEEFSIQQADHVPGWIAKVLEYEAELQTRNAEDIEKHKNPYRPTIEGKTEKDARKMYQDAEVEQAELGGVSLLDVSPSEFIVLVLDIESEQRRIRALADMKNASGTITGLRKKHRALNARIRRLRTLQATYMPGALRILAQTDLPQATLAERVPLLPPSALSATERGNGGCHDGLLEIEKTFRDAQCRSGLASLLVHLHVKSRLVLYKKNQAHKYQAAWRALVAIEGDVDKVVWKKLEKADIRCMEEPEDAAKRARMKRAAQRARNQRMVQLAHAGIAPMPGAENEMENSDDEDADVEREAQAIFGGTRAERNREANALFKHGEADREMSWIWRTAQLGGAGNEGMDEALQIEWAKAFARKRRWEEETRMSAEDLRRVPVSFTYEGRVWAKRGAGLDVDALGAQLAEGMLAYALKQADMYQDLASRAVITTTMEKQEPRRTGTRYSVEEWYGQMARDEGDGEIESESEDEHGNDSDEEDSDDE
uniref:CxC2-like cysteine cluster KDZ transposase-associated domain-containing protein n=1 Tax=Mycena chlorophos TaxID=658473 RepID=A0ABQ0LMV0_MYCCL|nr:predicted protein [Mycena chlorophos]